jgi:hypothetical protein
MKDASLLNYIGNTDNDVIEGEPLKIDLCNKE